MDPSGCSHKLSCRILAYLVFLFFTCLRNGCFLPKALTVRWSKEVLDIFTERNNQERSCGRTGEKLTREAFEAPVSATWRCRWSTKASFSFLAVTSPREERMGPPHLPPPYPRHPSSFSFSVVASPASAIQVDRSSHLTGPCTGTTVRLFHRCSV